MAMLGGVESLEAGTPLSFTRKLFEARNISRGWDRLNKLPSRFQSLKIVQETAIEEILDGFSRVPVVVVDAPTGSGKTVIGESVRLLLGVRGQYVCHSKSLQEQFLREFSWGKVLKGRGNYPTLDLPELFPDLSCGECGGGSCQWCERVESCPYQVAKGEALSSPVAVLNSAYWLSECNSYNSSFSRSSGLVVLDECDTLEKVVKGYVEANVSEWLVRRYNLGRPRYITKEDSWMDWLEASIPILSLAIREISGRDLDAIKASNRLRNTVERLQVVHDGLETGDWVMESQDQHISFRPIRVDKMGERLIWKHGTRFLLMSASVISASQRLSELGYQGSWEQVRIPSTFPVANRLVRVKPVCEIKGISPKTEELVSNVTSIVRRYVGNPPDNAESDGGLRRRDGNGVSGDRRNKDHRGRVLVHSVSYKLTADIVNGLEGQGLSCFSYTRNTEREGAIASWLESEDGIMVAPSLDRGLDLVGDLCRVQIICKVPYLNLGDKQVSGRLYSKGGQTWYSTDAISTLVQMCGRVVRGEEDWGVTYILDKGFLKLWREWKPLFPQWFAEAVRFN